MRAVFLISTLIALAAAQTSLTTPTSSSPGAASSSSSCQAQNILDTCLATTKATVANCAPNDYACLCQKYTDVLTCYNNCPNDSGKFGVEQTKLSNCNAASAYSSMSSTTSISGSSTVMSSTTTSASATSSSGSATAASASATHSGAAAKGGVGAGGFLVGVAAVMGAFL